LGRARGPTQPANPLRPGRQARQAHRPGQARRRRTPLGVRAPQARGEPRAYLRWVLSPARCPGGRRHPCRACTAGLGHRNRRRRRPVRPVADSPVGSTPGRTDPTRSSSAPSSARFAASHGREPTGAPPPMGARAGRHGGPPPATLLSPSRQGEHVFEFPVDSSSFSPI
jgi:hypothetical protein